MIGMRSSHHRDSFIVVSASSFEVKVMIRIVRPSAYAFTFIKTNKSTNCRRANINESVQLTLEVTKRCGCIVSLPTVSNCPVPMRTVAMCQTASDSFIIWLAEQHRRCLGIQVRYFSIIWRCDYLTSGFCWRIELNIFLVSQVPSMCHWK